MFTDSELEVYNFRAKYTAFIISWEVRVTRIATSIRASYYKETVLYKNTLQRILLRENHFSLKKIAHKPQTYNLLPLIVVDLMYTC